MISEFIRKLKKDLGYKTWKDSFYNYVHSRDRVSHPINYFLMYDIDTKSYSIKSEFTATYNQIVLLKARLPSKSDKQQIVIEEYKY